MTRTFWKPLAVVIAASLWGALPAQAQFNELTRSERSSSEPVPAEFGLVRVSDNDQAAPRMLVHATAASANTEPTPLKAVPPVPAGMAEIAPSPSICAPCEAARAAPTCISCTPSCNPSCNPACGCSSCGDCGCRDSSCGCPLTCPDPCSQCKLFGDCCCLKERGMTLEGYFDLGYTANRWGRDATWNGPVGFNDRADEFEMNQAFISLEKVTKSECGECDLGGRIDLVYGTDARWFESAGLEKTSGGVEKWCRNSPLYHLALVQAYAEVAKEDWKIKLGKWITPMEYEVIDSRGNFFYSHSYGFLYGVMFTHTGVMATKQVAENLSYSVGLSTGFDNSFDNEGRVDFVGNINWTSCDKNTNLSVSVCSGDQRNFYGVETNQTVGCLVWTQKINERLTNVVSTDLGVQQDGVSNARSNPSNATWYALEDYLLYQLSCNWWLGGRVEWFQDTDGTRVAPVGDTLTTSSLPGSNLASSGGFAGNFYEYTVGLNYKPLSNPNLVVRPELRYDNYSGTGHPFDNNTRNNQFLFAIDAIVKF